MSSNKPIVSQFPWHKNKVLIDIVGTFHCCSLLQHRVMEYFVKWFKLIYSQMPVHFVEKIRYFSSISNSNFVLSFLYRASFQRMEWKPTDVTILFVYCWISTYFGPTDPSSGEFVLLFTQPLVQFLSALDACSLCCGLSWWLFSTRELYYELSWRWACGPETRRDPAIYE